MERPWLNGKLGRKRKFAEITARYQAAMKDWEAEKTLAKAQKRQSQLTKPVHGPLPKTAPKPKKSLVPVEEQSDEEFDDGSNISSNSDEQ